MNTMTYMYCPIQRIGAELTTEPFPSASAEGFSVSFAESLAAKGVDDWITGAVQIAEPVGLKSIKQMVNHTQQLMG